MSTQINAKVIADSIYWDGPRLTTVEVHLPRFMLPELNTHRGFSRNSASSRAIPVEKQLVKVFGDPAMPVEWPREQKGMQGGAELDSDEIADAQRLWLANRHSVAMAVQAYLKKRPGDEGKTRRLHKSILNRMIEPWMWHTVVITATAWQNFFNQRCSPLAQPEIRVAAEAIRDAMEASEPEELKWDEWHLPYIEDGEWEGIVPLSDLAKISAARCARTSYETQDGVRDFEVDLDLYARLTEADPPHWSPLEHVATPWRDNRQDGFVKIPDTDNGTGQRIRFDLGHLPKVGNLLGWRSLRTTVEAERGLVTYQ